MSSDKEAKTVIEKVKKSFPISVKSRLVSLNLIIKQSNQGDTEYNSKNSNGEISKKWKKLSIAQAHVPYSSSRDVRPPKGGAQAEANCLAREEARADSKSCSSVSSSYSSSSEIN